MHRARRGHRKNMVNLPFGRRLPGAASLPDVVFACGRVRACPQARDDGAAFLDDFASIAHACPKVLLRVVLMCRFGVSPKRIGRNGKLSTVYQFGTGLAQFRSRGIA